MFNFIHRIMNPSASVLAHKALEESQRALVQHESAALYHRKMAEYARENCFRLAQVSKDITHAQNL
jgi:hypothetical protein